jgi:predicted nucleic acid-binding protein
VARRVAKGGAFRSAAGVVVLNSEGLAAAGRGDRRVVAVLGSARDRGARVVVSAVTLAEVLRGGQRDAGVHRVLKLIPIVPVTAEVGRAAGELLGRGGPAGATVDAVVAAAVLACPGPVLVLTSDLDDLTALTADRDDVRVVQV